VRLLCSMRNRLERGYTCRNNGEWRITDMYTIHIQSNATYQKYGNVRLFLFMKLQCA
jgi:hypothetical protein